VFTDAERTSLMAAGPSLGRNQPTEQIQVHQRTYVPKERNPAIGRWFAIVAVLAVLTVVVTVLLNFVGGNPRDVQIPDLRGQKYDEAVVSLQNLGFKTTRNQQPDNEVQVNEVISTDPPANTAAARDDQITINVSTGPQQAEIPDCAGSLSFAQCKSKLNAAGFDKVRQSPSGNLVVPKDVVIGTNPPANQTSAVTNEIIVVVSSGPDSKPIPDVAGQIVDVATQILVANGFTMPPIPVEVDGLGNTKGQVMGTVPPANTSAAVDLPIQLQVSRGNQFRMPDLRGKFWDTAAPQLSSLGWQNIGTNFNKLPDAQNSGVPTAGVVTQDPPPGTPMKPTDTITLSFAQ
jgi:serine/threonine-protein kinase